MQRQAAEQRRISEANVAARNEAMLKNLDIQRLQRESLNQQLLGKGQAEGQKLRDIYGAQAAQQQRIAQSQLGGIPAAWAGGTAGAEYQRGLYGSIAAVPTAMAGYQLSQAAARPQPQQTGAGQNQAYTGAIDPQGFERQRYEGQPTGYRYG